MHVFAVFAAYPAPIKEAAFGRLHKGGGLRPPPFVEPFVDGSGRCSSIKHQASSIKH